MQDEIKSRAQRRGNENPFEEEPVGDSFLWVSMKLLNIRKLVDMIWFDAFRLEQHSTGCPFETL